MSWPWMPHTVFDPGRRRLLERQFDVDLLPAHDREGILHECVEIKVQRHLVGMIGRRQGFDAFDGKHPWFPSQMAVHDEVQAAGCIPEPVRIDFAPGDAPS